MNPELLALYEALYEAAMAYPEATEDFPWGHPAIKVRKKVFLFLNNLEQDYVSFSMKLPESAGEALEHAFASPTGYGLGRHNWVSVKLTAPDLDAQTVLRWLRESYIAVAPKTLSRDLSPT